MTVREWIEALSHFTPSHEVHIDGIPLGMPLKFVNQRSGRRVLVFQDQLIAGGDEEKV